MRRVRARRERSLGALARVDAGAERTPWGGRYSLTSTLGRTRETIDRDGHERAHNVPDRLRNRPRSPFLLPLNPRKHRLPGPAKLV
jgi:hypothetical protein